MLMRVLGPFEVELDEGGTVDLGGPRQRAVLAVLLTARGEVVSVDRMIEDLWHGEAPPRAIASLQAYVSNLRRMLEPDRERRAPARLLVSAPPGYAIRLPEGGAVTVDAWRFEALLAEARAVGIDRPGPAKDLLQAALALWRGGAYAEFADEPWAVAEVTRLEELRLVARELLIDVTLRAGGAAEAVPLAEVLTHQHPLREESWRLLALALWSSGRQADALAALRRARRLLGDELGLDPGPALVEVEAAILGQRVELLHRRATPPAPPRVAEPQSVPDAELFVGRQAELAALRASAEDAAATGARIVLLTGEAGAGKSSVLARLHRELSAEGWLVVLGRCPEAEGAPAAWAWVEALRQLAQALPPGELADDVAPLLDDRPTTVDVDATGGRFRLHRAVGAWLRVAARQRPLAVVLDDLHCADAETLALLTSVAELGTAPVLLIVAFRPLDNRERLADTLATLARQSPQRVQLDGLAPHEVEQLVGAVTRTAVDPSTVAALAERTGGNPFYVRESARLLASEGALVATSEVPEGVRDVLRRRLSRLPQPAVAVLRLVAVVGREADVETLVGAADTDEAAVLDALDVGLIAGLLTEPAPGRVRFVHALVRDTMYTDLSQLRRTRMHARVAAVTERLRPHDLPALAHHYARAASSETAALAVEYAVRAAELAERRYAHDAAVELLSGAVAAAATVEGDRDALLVDLLGRLLRAQVRAGGVAAARATRGRAVEVAVQSGREALLIAAFAAWTEPSPWQIRRYGEVDHRALELLMRLLHRTDPAPGADGTGANAAPSSGGLDPATRCRLLDALSAELEQEGDPRALAAAREALTLARTLDDPAVLALAISSEARVLHYVGEVDRRAVLGAELRALAEQHGLTAYRWLAEQILATVATVRGEAAAVRQHVARQAEIAEAYQMVEPRAAALSAQAMLAHIEARFEDAKRHYDEARSLLVRHGSLHSNDFGLLAQLTLLISQGRLAEQLQTLQTVYRRYGGPGTDMMALALAQAGRHDDARALHPGREALRPDYFESAFLTVRAMALVAVDLKEPAEEIIERLRPARDQLAGASSAAIAMRPVAHSIAELLLLLGRRAEAEEHFGLALDVARRWGAPRWTADATAALRRLS